MAEGFAWRRASPESQGMDGARLEAMREELARRGTKTLLIVRNDRIVYEWYAEGFGPDVKHYSASLAKAVVGGMSLALAMNDGRISPWERAAKYIPAWRDDPLKSRITIQQLATHCSGIQDAEHEDVGHMELPGWMGKFWRRQPDPFSVAIHEAPVIFEPGTQYHYSNPGMAALAYAVTASLQGAPQSDIRSLLKERVFDPLGVPENHWSIGYGRAYEVDGLRLYANWGGGAFTARAVAAVGRLMMRRGDWDGRQLLRPGTVERVLEYQGTPLPPRPEGNPQPGSGLCFWVNFDRVWRKVPRDAFGGAGAGNQVLLVVPSLNLIIVRNGSLIGTEEEGLGFWGGVEKYLFNPVMEAIQDTPVKALGEKEPPYPPSPVIRKVTFAPVSEIRRDCIDSDNFPITWAEDDALYTAYGDGWGFEPRTEKKLSLGFAKVLGGPEDFRGVNIRSETGELTGDGPAGGKASGMLCVDGVLYMWVRNLGNSQLAWSEDHGRTWHWGFKFETSFGCPTFLNFGRNYEGARDRYVYTYSNDGPSAYESYDGMVLARVPRQRIRDREAYEFFVRLDERGEPVWTRDIDQRGHVFVNPKGCQRSDVVYNPGIKRYLMCLGIDHEGSWGIFDAPEPWGPWTTAFFTEYWGLGRTHYYRIPSKWISPDGRTMYLVFSGRNHNGVVYDAFCVRKLTLSTAAEERR